MRLTLALSMIALLAVTMTIQAQSRSTNPVATIKQIQEAMISPSSDTIFNVGRAAPASDEEWLVVRNAAVILAEAGNLLMLEGRAKDTEQWMDLAGELVAAGNDALVAAESQDVAAVLDSGNRIAAACEACHQPYRMVVAPWGRKRFPINPNGDLSSLRMAARPDCA